MVSINTPPPSPAPAPAPKHTTNHVDQFSKTFWPHGLDGPKRGVKLSQILIYRAGRRRRTRSNTSDSSRVRPAAPPCTSPQPRPVPSPCDTRAGGEGANPGAGGWPTIRYYNKETGILGKSYEKKTDASMCDELGPKGGLLQVHIHPCWLWLWLWIWLWL